MSKQDIKGIAPLLFNIGIQMTLQKADHLSWMNSWKNSERKSQ